MLATKSPEILDGEGLGLYWCLKALCPVPCHVSGLVYERVRKMRYRYDELDRNAGSLGDENEVLVTKKNDQHSGGIDGMP